MFLYSIRPKYIYHHIYIYTHRNATLSPQLLPTYLCMYVCTYLSISIYTLPRGEHSKQQDRTGQDRIDRQAAKFAFWCPCRPSAYKQALGGGVGAWGWYVYMYIYSTLLCTLYSVLYIHIHQ